MQDSVHFWFFHYNVSPSLLPLSVGLPHPAWPAGCAEGATEGVVALKSGGAVAGVRGRRGCTELQLCLLRYWALPQPPTFPT